MSENLSSITEAIELAVKAKPKDFAEAMDWAQKFMPNLIEGTGTNPHFKSDFIEFEQLIQVTRAVLLPLGLRFRQVAHVLENNDVGIETIISGYGEEESHGVLPIKAQTQTPHGSGGAVTYGKRYSLAMALNISHQKDDDANKAQKETVERKTTGWTEVVGVNVNEYTLKKGKTVIIKNDDTAAFLESCRTHLRDATDKTCQDIFKSSEKDIQRALSSTEDAKDKQAFGILVGMFNRLGESDGA